MHYASADTTIPSWIKSNAKYWKDGQIVDYEYVQGIQYLIQIGMIQIPYSDEAVQKSSMIPSWVKNSAVWWADDSIEDSEYVSAIQYLVGVGMIDISHVYNLYLVLPKQQVHRLMPILQSVIPWHHVLTGKLVWMTSSWTKNYKDGQYNSICRRSGNLLSCGSV